MAARGNRSVSGAPMLARRQKRSGGQPPLRPAQRGFSETG
jgi:hypothetical protein